jgi:hypothetical protein
MTCPNEPHSIAERFSPTVPWPEASPHRPFQALLAKSPSNGLPSRSEARGRRGCSPDYGPLVPVKDHTTGLPLLMLPEGFEYLTFGWTGDRMSDGVLTPSNHDGMATFRGRHGRIRLVRNHEIDGAATPFTLVAYDAHAGGGTTTLEFDVRSGELGRELCEPQRNGAQLCWRHDALGVVAHLRGDDLITQPRRADPTTRLHLRRASLRHCRSDAVQGDGSLLPRGRGDRSRTGIVYETEDATPGGFYRFVPTTGAT